MSEYTLDDDLVREFISRCDYQIANSADGWHDVIGAIGSGLKAQLPLPVPTKIGAVVRTEDGAVWVLAPCGKHWMTETDAFQDGRDHTGLRDFVHRDQIGRIVEVLAPGVEIG